MMVVILLVLVSLFTISRAQTCSQEITSLMQADEDCYMAYQQATNPDPNTIRSAYSLMCDPTRSCYSRINGVLETCRSLPGADQDPLFITLLVATYRCITQSDGTSCADVINGGQSDNPGLEQLGEEIGNIFSSCSLQCTESCSMLLSGIADRYGCCAIEFFDHFVGVPGYSSSTRDALVGIYQSCSMDYGKCTGSGMSATACINATVELFGLEDACATAATGVNTNLFLIGYDGIVNAGIECLNRFDAYLSACEPAGDPLQFRIVIATLKDISVAPGCNDSYYGLLTNRVVGESKCPDDFLRGTCSDNCRNIVLALTAAFGCCFQRYSGFYTASLDPAFQISGALFSGELYDLCGITQPGFCDAPVNTQFPDSTNRCFMSQERYLTASGVCVTEFNDLGGSLEEANSAANTICNTQSCRDYIPEVAEYFNNCSLLSLLPLIDDISTRAQLLLGNLCTFGPTGSCYVAHIMNTSLTELLSDALDVSDPSALCSNALQEDGTCTTECNELLSNVFDEIGCCLGDTVFTLIGADLTLRLAQSCSPLQLLQRCGAANPPTVTSECFAAMNTLQKDSTCSKNFEVLTNYQRGITAGVNLTQLNNRFGEICESSSCRDLTNSYLTNCVPADNRNNFGFNVTEVQVEFNAYGCKSSSAGNCYALELIDSGYLIQALAVAFSPGGDCSSLLSSTICSSLCKSIIQRTVDSVGCCVYELGATFLASSTKRISEVYQECSLTTEMCENVGGGGSAGTVKAFEMLAVLLLGIMTAVLLY